VRARDARLVMGRCERRQMRSRGSVQTEKPQSHR
jgi:hypothetical protein